MFAELWEVFKTFGLGAVGCVGAGVGIVSSSGKVSKQDFQDYKDKIENRLNLGAIKFAEIDKDTKCLPSIQESISTIQQDIAAIRATMAAR